MNIDALHIPDHVAGSTIYTPVRTISAIRLLPSESGAHLGQICELHPGTELQPCGDGFNERTAKVRCEGEYYFVFREDISPKRMLRAE